VTDRDIGFMTAGDLAAKIRSRALSPIEVVEATLRRISASRPTINAYITVCAEEARAAARTAEAAIVEGGPLPPLHGVPISVKDNINTAGVKTTFGSRLLTANVPAADALAVARLKEAGAIVIGKTTTPEQAHKLLTDAPLFGTTRNPWNLDLTAGGSSGGAAAAVAAGLGPLALATDAGASTRQPAACCGVVGFKPTLGVVPHNQVPEGFGNFIHLGVLARTVADAALMLEAVAGEHVSDPYSHGRHAPPFRRIIAASDRLDGLRFAWRPLLGNRLLARAVREACETALHAFEGLGGRVEPVEEEVENAEPTWRVLQQSNWGARFEKDAAENADKMDPSFVEGIREGLKYSGRELQRAMYRRTQFYRSVQLWFDKHDFILTPTISRPPLSAGHGALDPIAIEGADAGDMRNAWVPYLNLFNLTGNPAISVPCGWTADGLPVGLQIVGRWYADAEVLRVAAAFETARPWADRIPPHAVS
jgi:aspartyl-tRNA(Asn)/glutamyl-tRNA(Gln) amidotransferase subunit A